MYFNALFLAVDWHLKHIQCIQKICMSQEECKPATNSQFRDTCIFRTLVLQLKHNMVNRSSFVAGHLSTDANSVFCLTPGICSQRVEVRLICPDSERCLIFTEFLSFVASIMLGML